MEDEAPISGLDDVLELYWGAGSAPGDQMVIAQIREIEESANRLLDRLAGRREHPRTTFEIRSVLHAMKVWTDDDLATFDRAMDVRNSVVHGSSRRKGPGPTRAEIRELSEKIAAATAKA